MTSTGTHCYIEAFNETGICVGHAARLEEWWVTYARDKFGRSKYYDRFHAQEEAERWLLSVVDGWGFPLAKELKRS